MTNTKQQKNKNWQGFTLVETLIVLLVCSIFLFLPVLAIKEVKRSLEVDQFIAAFEKKLLFTQQLAIVDNHDTQVVFDEPRQEVYFLTSSSIKEGLAIPPDINMSGPQKITFKKGTGNNGKLSKYSFFWKNKQLRIDCQFQLGSGRYVKTIKKY
ncbi:prepilin-type N-terminal cleavage/methylation domain-containing protein [Erwinia sp. CPCC 100877]|nr:prepilin-type N-terminal cleavage/methylation domain-containing protein [Erwinia sp. CPCC 100877]